MEDLIDKITNIFKEQLPGCATDIASRPGGYVGGFLTSDRFEGMDMEERQKLIWNLLRGRLSQDEIGKVTAIFTQTENEYSIMLEESEAV